MSSSGPIAPEFGVTSGVNSPAQSVFSHRVTRFGLSACILLSLVAGFSQLPTRDTWMDEVWSMFLSDPSIPIGSLIFDRWAYDIHPPLFMWLARCFRSLVADEIPAARMLNLLVLLPALAYLASLWNRAPAMRAVLALFAPVFCSGMLFVHYAAEFRVYFMLILVSAVYALSSYRVIVTTVSNQPMPPLDQGVMMASAFMLMSLHVLAMPFVLMHAGLIVLLLVLMLGMQGAQPKLLRLRGYWTVIAMALLSLAGFYLFIEDFQQGTTAGGSWIAAVSLPQAILRIGKWVFKMAPGVVALGLIFWTPFLKPSRMAASVSSASGPSTSDPAMRTAHEAEQLWLWSMLLTLGGFVGMMLCANLKTPLMVDRYFAVMTGPLAAVLAVLAARVLLRLASPVQALVLAAAIANSVAATVYHVATEKTVWNEGLYYAESLNYVKTLNVRCDQPLLHATDNRLRYAVYQAQLGDWVARYLGPPTGLQMRAAGPDTPIRATPQCPVALWLPFISRGGAAGMLDSVISEHKLVLDGVSVDQLEIQLLGSTAIVRLKP